MKFTAFLAVSLPLLAMTCVPAIADTDALASTGSWLRSSIATLKAPPKPAATKVAHAMPDTSLATTKLRPFTPNRYLPHERDLRRGLLAQPARFDSSASGDAASMRELSGEVSTSYMSSYMSSNDRYASAMGDLQASQQRFAASPRKPVVSRSPRVMPGQAPMLPEQLCPPSHIQPFLPEPPPPAQQTSTRPQFPITIPACAMSQMQSFASQPLTTANEPPPISVQEQKLLERLMAQNKPTAIMDSNGDIYGTIQDNPNYGTGPSPFPMSILPGNAMQRLSQSRRPANVPQARFGSWHDSSALPECGFHSYLPHRQPHLFSYVTAPMPRDRRAVPRRPGKPNAVAPHTVAQSAAYPQPAKPLMIATYPTYVSGRGLAY